MNFGDTSKSNALFKAGIFFVHFCSEILCYLGKRSDFKLHNVAILPIFFANKVGAGSVGMDEVYARGLSCLVHVGPRQREGPAPHQEASAAPTSSL